MRPHPTALLTLALVAAGCAGGAGTASPRPTLETLRAAVHRNDVATLYALLPEHARRQEPFERFRARMQSDRQELVALSSGVERALQDGHDPHVEVPLAGGGSVTTVEDAEGWRVSRPGFGPVTAATPTDAARALHAALLRQSLPAILQVLSARARGSLQAEIASLVEALRDPSGLDIAVISTQRVEVHLPDGRNIVVVREGDSWRVDDIQ